MCQVGRARGVDPWGSDWAMGTVERVYKPREAGDEGESDKRTEISERRGPIVKKPHDGNCQC